MKSRYGSRWRKSDTWGFGIMITKILEVYAFEVRLFGWQYFRVFMSGEDE